MSYSVKIYRKAIGDIQEAIDFYESRITGLGKPFEQELNSNVVEIAKHPHREIKYANVHCVPLKRFPFMIHYTVDSHAEEIFIRAVFHTSLDPNKWDRKDD